MSPDKQARAVQAIWAGPDHPLFVAIGHAFQRAHPAIEGRADVFCGAASSLGHVNAITVTAYPGVRLRLPRHFMSMPVIRRRQR